MILLEQGKKILLTNIVKGGEGEPIAGGRLLSHGIDSDSKSKYSEIHKI